MKKILLLIGFILIFCCQAVYTQAQKDEYREPYIADSITFALAGDAIITRKLSPYKEPQYLKMIDLIRESDVGFVNCEMQFLNYADAYPTAHSGDDLDWPMINKEGRSLRSSKKPPIPMGPK